MTNLQLSILFLFVIFTSPFPLILFNIFKEENTFFYLSSFSYFANILGSSKFVYCIYNEGLGFL